MELLERLFELGKSVDPLMERYILRHASRDFADPLLYPIRMGGKRIRPALTLASCMAAGGEVKAAMPAAASVELAHNYSLILDDIIDHSELRRGMPTVWKKYGISTAILIAVHYRESISEALNDTVSPRKFQQLMAKTLKVLVDGERLDILFEQAGRLEEPYVQENRITYVTFEEYLDMVRKKTSALIEASCTFGALSAQAVDRTVEALSRYGRMLGVAFQIGDDLIDLFGKRERTGKMVGGDIKEHKLGNAVIALALEELPESERAKLLEILRKHTVDNRDIARAVSIISRYSKARERAEALRNKYVSEALEAISPLPDSEAKELLTGIADFIARREF